MPKKQTEDRLNPDIVSALSGAKAEVRASLDSTNNLAKAMALEAPHGFTVLAETQTAGRGRRGHSFASVGSGIYMSTVLRPNCAGRLPLVTAAAAVAVRDAVWELCGADCSIKWVNDLYFKGKKVCGILAEAVAAPGGGIDSVVVGIGINFRGSAANVPEELRPIVGFLFERELPVSRSALAGLVVKNLLDFSGELSAAPFLESYKEHSLVLGKEVEFLKNGERVSALAVDIDGDCGLVVEFPGGSREILRAGEISVRPTLINKKT